MSVDGVTERVPGESPDVGTNVGHMTDEPAARTLLIDSFDRIRGLVADLTDGLTEEVATYRPDPEANSIAWLVWHLTRIQDDHVAALAGVDQAWPHWRESFRLPFSARATGYGQTSDDVAAVRVDGELLGKYHCEVHELTGGTGHGSPTKSWPGWSTRVGTRR